MSRPAILFPYVLAQWRWLTAILALTVLSAGAAALQPWPMKLLVDYGLGNTGTPESVTAALGAFGLSATPQTMVILAAVSSLVLFALTSVLGVGLSVSWSMAGQRMAYALAGDLFARLQRLSLRFHSRRSVGDSLSRILEDTWCVAQLADTMLMAPIQQTITLVVMICIGFALDPVLATLALAVAPLLALSSRYFGKRLKQRSKLGREAKSRLMSFVHQTFSAIPVVQTFGTQSRNTARFEELAADTVRLARRGNLLSSSYGLINGLVTTTGMALVLFVGGARVLSETISLGTLLVFLAYVRQMQSSSGGLFDVFTKIKAAEASVERISEVLHCDEMVRDPAAPVCFPDRPRGQRGHVRLEGITVGYEPGQPVLHNVTLEMLPGKRIALVGPTGTGKTTLASLVPRFFDPWEGRVTLDGVDIRDVRLADLRSRISIVLQDPFLLPLSVADNIAYGSPEAIREEIVAAAVAAQADEFIRQLPEGYDTVVGERGATLSGGERQRITIARALLRDAPVVILDEPTSSLDARTEASLTAAFDRLMQGRTTLVIAHRMSTIRGAHRIAVLEHGRLAELGSHDELLELEGIYWRFHARQRIAPPIKVVA
jgi:ATP-binding cassette subfamily B protein/subfamily B ATP-binding cassette protein MsbA